MTNYRLGDLLLSIGLIDEEQLKQALEVQKQTKDRLGNVLINKGYITESQLIEALKLQLGIDSIDLTVTSIPPEMANVLPKTIAKKYGVVPLKVNKDVLFLAMSDPLNFMALEEVKTATRKKVIPLISTVEATDRAIATLYGNEGAARAIEEMKREVATEDESGSAARTDDVQSAPTVRLVNSILERALSEGASDIHMEPEEKELRVRMRIDGLMRNILSVPRNLQASVISRVKIIGTMDIAERRVPQDGRANFKLKDKDVDLRISTLPTIYGEKVVIRLLDKNAGILDKNKIGLLGDDLKKYMQLVTFSSGVVLIVGPTGSGKTSTMYAMIRDLNTEQVNLVTLEDPVEYNIAGVNQVQINEKTGLTFAEGLRAILRQDPDIIAVGEIRDGETAEIAMRAALTGHLVLSTVHTSDALSTIDRLRDIGVEPYLIAGGLKGIVSQRLVRRICTKCREAYEPTQEELDSIGLKSQPGQKFYRGKGCAACFHTGYRGRTGVFEILIMDSDIRSGISAGKSRKELEQMIRAGGKFVSLTENCHQLVLAGITSIEEARRTINSAEF